VTPRNHQKGFLKTDSAETGAQIWSQKELCFHSCEVCSIERCVRDVPRRMQQSETEPAQQAAILRLHPAMRAGFSRVGGWLAALQATTLGYLEAAALQESSGKSNHTLKE